MKSKAFLSTILPGILLGVGFTATVLYLFHAQFASGDVYPEYSSLRTDAQGTKLLLDSLARIPGLSVERSFLPLVFLQEDRATVLLLGLNPESFARDPDPYLQSIQKLAARGNRIVAALEMDSDAETPRADALENMWHVRFGRDSRRKRSSLLYFAEAVDWKVLESIGPRLFAIERPFGKGSVVLLAASGDFSNQSTVAADRLKQVSAAIGPNTRIVFDEQHLGISESGSVVGLARRFHLTGLAFGLALCAALFIWKNASAFPPPVARPPAGWQSGWQSERQAGRMPGRTSLSGLLTLLRRHIPANQMAAVCWREWLIANRRQVTPERASRAAAIIGSSAGRPLDAMREIQAVLHSTGPNSKGES
jgi:hypothetical protein